MDSFIKSVPTSTDITSSGSLPAKAPLGSAYVPFQNSGDKMYKQGVALNRGTLYPSLDFPFKHFVNTGELPPTPKTELMAMDFALGELGLYLDTHPGDTEAVEVFNTYLKMYDELRRRYEQMYGPMTNRSHIPSKYYDWIKSPWPWDPSDSKED